MPVDTESMAENDPQALLDYLIHQWQQFEPHVRGAAIWHLTQNGPENASEFHTAVRLACDAGIEILKALERQAARSRSPYWNTSRSSQAIASVRHRLAVVKTGYSMSSISVATEGPRHG